LQAGVVKRAERPEAAIVCLLQGQARKDAADLKSAMPELQPVGGPLNQYHHSPFATRKPATVFPWKE
jgi:hypothetical protein